MYNIFETWFFIHSDSVLTNSRWWDFRRQTQFAPKFYFFRVQKSFWTLFIFIFDAILFDKIRNQKQLEQNNYVMKCNKKLPTWPKNLCSLNQVFEAWRPKKLQEWTPELTRKGTKNSAKLKLVKLRKSELEINHFF